MTKKLLKYLAPFALLAVVAAAVLGANTEADWTGGTDGLGNLRFSLLTITSADINGGTIDATAIGGTTPAAGAFTTITSSSGLDFSGNVVLANDEYISNATDAGVYVVFDDDAVIFLPSRYPSTNFPEIPGLR